MSIGIVFLSPDSTSAEVVDAMNDPRGDLAWQPKHVVHGAYDAVPSHIAEAASEAHACHSIESYRGAVLLARSVVEATAKDLGITSGHLHSKIEAMYDKGRIRELVRDQAHEVRHLGNDMAHGDFVEPVTAEEAEEVLGLMAEVLDEVYQAPARLAARREKRIARTKASPQT